jgi:hypothetical protein
MCLILDNIKVKNKIELPYHVSSNDKHLIPGFQ